MAIKKETYDKLYNLSSKQSSWALYPDFNEKDITSMIPLQQANVWNFLNDKYVILALNPGREISPKPWFNFHSNIGSGARRLREVTKNTELEGCYITDVYKKEYSSKSGDLSTYASNKEKVANSLPKLRQELELLNHPIIIALGDGVENFVKLHLTDYKYVKMWHYSYFGDKNGGVNDERYFQKWWQTLEDKGIEKNQNVFQK